MAAQVANGVAEETRPDLAQLWQAAVEEYEEATGRSLQMGRLDSMDAVMKGTEGIFRKFKTFRDDTSKVAKVRSALKNNMFLIQNIIDIGQNLGNAASAFPPAMPASLIFTAFGQVMQSFADVSADYDKIMGFLDFTHRFFDRLSMIDQKMPNMPPFQRCVIRVFSSILKICSVAQRYAAEKRLKKWFENLMMGSDGELAAASTQMEEAMNELNQALGLATFRTVDAMSEVLQSMVGNGEFLVSNAILMDKRTAAIQDNTTTIIDQNQELASNQKAMADIQQETLQKLGEHFGQVEITPKQLESSPKPISTVPFSRDPEFINRGTLLDEVDKRLSKLRSDEKDTNPRSRIAFVGLGGVGKSQLAIECSYRIREQSPDTWVFWVYASNTARFEQSYWEIANRAKITGRHDPQANIFKLVCDWLQDAKNKKWVLILDNVDDDDVLQAHISVNMETQVDIGNGAFKQPLSAFIPQCQHGLLIMTTRSRSVASKIVDDSDIIAVNPMDKSQASALMEKKLGIQANKEDISKLIEALEFMPLAIVQAAAYIKCRAPRCSIPQYLETLQKTDHKMARLLSYEAGHRQRDWEAKNSILITWQLSFDYIRKIRPSAADLLSLMSFFDRQGIPEDLLHDVKAQRDAGGSDDDSSTDEDSDDGFEDDIMTLRDYSFISMSQDAKVFEMHRLVQLSTRTWLEASGQIERWKELFIDKLYNGFPSGDDEDWGGCQFLFSHIKSAMSQRPNSEESLQKWASLLIQGVSYALDKGIMIDLEPMAVKAMKARKKVFGAEHPDTLSSMGNLAATFWRLGRFPEAESLGVQVVETSKRIHGAEHPDTLTWMSNLAAVLSDLGRLQEAERLKTQLVDTSKRVLGEDHPDTLGRMRSLAFEFSSLGRNLEAEALEVQVLEAQKRVLGEEHPHTLITLNNLAVMYLNQGRFLEAKALEVQVLEARRKVLGEEHPHTLNTLNNLAVSYWNLGQFSESEALQTQVLETRKRVLGEDHPETLISMGNLASTLSHLDRLPEVEVLQMQVLESRKRILGEEHPDTLLSMGEQAFTLLSLGRFQEAHTLQVQVVEAFKRILGEEHPKTLTSMHNLASIYWKLGRLPEAEALLVQILETRKRVLGEDHPDTLTSMDNLASIFRDLGRLPEAEALEIQVLQTRKAKLGETHPDTLESTADLE
ncbi:uncharacterized protein N7503_003908 [Penicillium pulvis]|uniref:uncharacterized protein n=1 Tax=Penicillium pulvis TaxID=1562058 RepID=UPI002547E2FD|nr:uncharacterized protein N7503_003908 [Penicillium pulvis]KAJ5806306.1 hypothetical protein N7503_003908 [Penicillium pulvis]